MIISEEVEVSDDLIDKENAQKEYDGIQKTEDLGHLGNLVAPALGVARKHVRAAVGDIDDKVKASLDEATKKYGAMAEKKGAEFRKQTDEVVSKVTELLEFRKNS